MSRYKVATCTGYTINPRGQSGGQTMGLTASVLDTSAAHREVKRFRSEDRARGLGLRRRGIEGAVKAAEDYAAKLNAEHERR